MKRLRWTFAAFAVGLLALVGGCRKGIDDPVDPDQASVVLQSALDAWKQGESFGALEKRNPPIYFNEPEWKAGKKLVAFEVGKVDLLGRQGRCSVKLSLRDKDGNETERKTSYLIDTTPRVVITREALGP
jgi:hypothetical protein